MWATIGHHVDHLHVHLLPRWPNNPCRGPCAWLVEKLWTWTDQAAGRQGLSRDQLLDDVTLYWLTGTAASSTRLYWESIEQVGRWLSEPRYDLITVPTGCSLFAAEVPRPSRRWAQRRYPDIRYWAEHDRGGRLSRPGRPRSPR